MIVILNRDIKGTGKAGDVVKVSDGYARNMLIPKGWALEATKGNINTLEKVKAKKAEEEAARKAAAEELASHPRMSATPWSSSTRSKSTRRRSRWHSPSRLLAHLM